MQATFWSALLLFFMLTFCSIIAVQVVHPLNKQVADTGEYDDCPRCKEAFESVMAANLTFLKTIVAGDSWRRVSIPIMEKFPSTIFVFTGMLLSIVFGVMNLVLSCTVNRALESREADQKFQLARQRSMFQKSCEEFAEICQSLDTQRRGLLTKEEMHLGFDRNEHFTAVMQSMNMRRDDMEMLFQLMDKNLSGDVNYEEFILALYQVEFLSPKTVLAFIRHSLVEIKKGAESTASQEMQQLRAAYIEQQREHVQLMKQYVRTIGNLSVGQPVTRQGYCTDSYAKYAASQEFPGDAFLDSLDHSTSKLENRLCSLLAEVLHENPVCQPSDIYELHIDGSSEDIEETIPAERHVHDKAQNRSNSCTNLVQNCGVSQGYMTTTAETSQKSKRSPYSLGL